MTPTTDFTPTDDITNIAMEIGDVIITELFA